MMDTVFVTTRLGANDDLLRLRCGALISCNDIRKRTFQFRVAGSDHLQVEFEDEIVDGPFAPKRHHVERTLNFARDRGDFRLLVNCEAGVSRSTAVALMILTDRLGDVDAAGEALLRVRPMATPNSLITEIADDLLGCGGRLVARAEAICRKQWRTALR